MPKQEYQIVEFHGGSNNKADPRDIPDKQNVFSAISVRNPGKLGIDGSFKSKYAASIDNHQGIWEGRGLFFALTDRTIKNYITYLAQASSSNTVGDGAMFNLDGKNIQAYSDGAWIADVLELGKVDTDYQSSYHYAYGGLRAYVPKVDKDAIANFTLNGTSASANEYGDEEGKLLTTIKLTGSAVDTSISAGNIVDINGELVLCVSYDTGTNTMRCIRGVGGTHAITHAYQQAIHDVYVPKFFGLIKKTMFSETDNPEEYDIWTEDIMCLQKPRNTGHSVPTSGNIAPFMDIDNEKALTVFENFSGTTAPFPTNSEKVRLYFSEGNQRSVAITSFDEPDGNNVTVNCLSEHGLASGEIVTISETSSNAYPYVGTWKIKNITDTTFSIDTINTHSSAIAAVNSAISGWASYTSTATEEPYNQGSLKITTTDADIPGSAGETFFASFQNISGGDSDELNNAVGAKGYGKVFEMVRIDANNAYFATNVPVDSLSGGTVHILNGVARDQSYGQIDENLKRAWKFGISWTYDSPDAREQQESLITTAYKGSVDELNTRANANSPGSYWNTVGGGTEANDVSGWGMTDGDITSIADTSDSGAGSRVVQFFADSGSSGDLGMITLNDTSYLSSALTHGQTYRLRLRAKHVAGGQATFRFNQDADLNNANSKKDVYIMDSSDTDWRTIDVTFKHDSTNTAYFGIIDTESGDSKVYINVLSIVKESKMDETHRVNWTGFESKPIMHLNFNHLASTHRWNERISGFSIYMKDVTHSEDDSEWRSFCYVDFNRGVYTLPVVDSSEFVLERTDAGLCSTSTGTTVDVLPTETYTTRNFYTPETLINAQFKTSAMVGNRVFIGNVFQGGEPFPDKMLFSPPNKFDVFPETNFIDVATNDGEDIVHLASYNDYLLQFKRNTVYIINVGKVGEEYLEQTYKYAGIKNPSQVCLTSNGICWICESGLIIFDGQSIINLTENVEDLGFTTLEGTAASTKVPIIGYDPKSNRVIYTPSSGDNKATKWYAFDFNLNAHSAYNVGDFAPYCHDGANSYTNMINAYNGELVLGHVGGDDPDKIYFYQWDNDSHGFEKPDSASIWESKDIDFGSPGSNKKVYKIYVTYKSNGHSGITMKYSTNGNASESTFDPTSSTNYTDKIFQNTHNGSRPQWQVAELKPSSSINNIKSIQLKLQAYQGDTLTSAGGNKLGGTVTGGSSSTINLVSETSPGANYYDNYCVGVYDGDGRFNVRRISSHTDADPVVASVTPNFTDVNYGAAPSAGSLFKMGVVTNNFQINDITIVYRPKRIK